MAWSRNCGRTFWLLFPFIFFGAFQLVLLYLFGQSIIAVDMFLNLVTTNSSEALELLDNLIPAIVIVVVLYIPALILATISIVHKRRLSEAFREAALADSLESTPCHLDVSRGKWHRRTTGSLPDTIARKSSDTAYKQKVVT